MSTINGNVCVVDGVAVDKVFSNGKQVYGRNLLLNSGQQFAEILDEFVYTKFNLNDIFDKYGTNQVYTISYDLSSKNPSKVNWIKAYPFTNTTPQNKYDFPMVQHQGITTTPQRFSMTFKPTLVDATITKTTLVFYGEYGSGNIPIVNHIKAELGDKATPWTPAPEDVLKGDITAPKNLTETVINATTKKLDWEE